MKKIPWKWLAVISALVLSVLAVLAIKLFPRQKSEATEEATRVG